MCGIAGILKNALKNSDNSTREVSSVIKKMTKILSHRGPDAEGYFISNNIVLGHRRLSILDVSATGAQPMELFSGGPVITFNGEIYNFIELKRKLRSLGHFFRGNSDTEVILHAYNAWGLDGLKQLEGIFAIAIWDPIKLKLILMRDKFGVKPLFYGDSTLGFAFGSEIKAVLAAGGVDSVINQQAFSEYLWHGNTFEDRTFYSGIVALLPGHWLIIENGKKKLSSWWRIEELLNRPTAALTEEQATEQVRTALNSSVSRQLLADVPVGIFLSGGIDSSAIASSAMHVQRIPIKSYSAAFDFDKGVNELRKAREVANHLGLDHHELHITGANLPKILKELAYAHDEPFADAGNIPLYMMSQKLNGKIKVVLQGDGGDEMFAGYSRYAILRNSRWWSLWPSVLNKLTKSCGNIGKRFARIAGAVGNKDAALRMGLLLTLETLDDPPDSLLRTELKIELAKSTDPFLAYRNAAKRFTMDDPVQQMLLTDLTVELPSKFLTKVDRSTMASGIEARVPMLDERVAEVAVGMPSHWKAKGVQKKVILRNSQRLLLPKAILDSPKVGFGVPFSYWLCSSLKEYTRQRLLDQSSINYFNLDKQFIESTLSQISPISNNKSFLVWKLLQLVLWKETQKA